MKTLYATAAALAALAFVPCDAHAVIIRNVSGQPQTVVIDQGAVRDTIRLEAGQVLRRFGPDIAVVTPNGNTIQTQTYEEYAIWPDGKMHIQKREISRGNSY